MNKKIIQSSLLVGFLILLMPSNAFASYYVFGEYGPGTANDFDEIDFDEGLMGLLDLPDTIATGTLDGYFELQVVAVHLDEPPQDVVDSDTASVEYTVNLGSFSNHQNLQFSVVNWNNIWVQFTRTIFAVASISLTAELYQDNILRHTQDQAWAITCTPAPEDISCTTSAIYTEVMLSFTNSALSWLLWSGSNYELKFKISYTAEIESTWVTWGGFGGAGALVKGYSQIIGLDESGYGTSFLWTQILLEAHSPPPPPPPPPICNSRYCIF